MTKQSERCGAALVSLAREVMRFSLPRLSVRAHWRTPARTCGAGCRLRGAVCGEAAVGTAHQEFSKRCAGAEVDAAFSTCLLPGAAMLTQCGGRLAPQPFWFKVQAGYCGDAGLLPSVAGCWQDCVCAVADVRVVLSVRRKLAERLRVVGYDARRQRAETASVA